MIQTGQEAPQFTLFASDKQEVSLESFRGKKVVLLFFPLAFTNTCTKELCSVRDNISQYNEANAVVMAISVDSVPTLAKFKEEQHLNFPVLSDFNKEVSAKYETQYETFGFGMKGVSKRAAFVIDSQGVIRYREVLEDANKVPDFDQIQETLASIA